MVRRLDSGFGHVIYNFHVLIPNPDKGFGKLEGVIADYIDESDWTIATVSYFRDGIINYCRSGFIANLK